MYTNVATVLVSLSHHATLRVHFAVKILFCESNSVESTGRKTGSCDRKRLDGARPNCW
jgi:hypothetical protein